MKRVSDVQEILAKLEATLPKRSFQSTLFNLAHAYALASNSTWRAGEAARNPDFAGPAIMCQSFAIELLLKFFLAVDHPEATSAEDLRRAGVKLKCHKYSELYDQLSAKTKEQIAQSFAALSGKPTDDAGFRKALVAHGDDPFVHWRYIYEAKANSYFDRPAFNLVTDALGKAAEQFRKSSPAKER